MATPVEKYTQTDASTFYCFSPFVMLLTFVFEITMAVYVAVLHRLKTPVQRLVFVMLVLLASFQMIEYVLCQQHNQQAINVLARAGFVVITFLPVLGFHLSSALVHRRWLPWYVYFCYVLAVGWSFYFIFVQSSIVMGLCGANYAILDLPEGIQNLYGTYYWGLLAIGAWEAYTLSRRKMFKKYSAALLFLVLGYLVFMVPTVLSVVIYPTTFRAIPSIMCGFAVIFAALLTFYILPRSEKD